MNKVTANKLYELRKNNGLSQEELADKIGVSRQAVSKWERGEASPDTDNLIALANLYNVSLDELIGRDEVKEKIVIEDTIVIDSKEDDDNDDDDEDDESNHLSWLNPLLLFVAIIAMLLLGILFDFWSWSWLTILVWIVVISTIKAIRKKRVNKFNYPVLVTLIYLFLGLATPHIWHPTWILFVSIPLFYIIANAIDGHFKKK